MLHIIAITNHHDAVTQLQHQIGRCQQLHTRAVDAGDSGMVAVAYIEATQSFTIALGASDHHTTRDKVRRTFTTTKTIVRNLPQHLQLILMAAITDNAHHIIRMKERIGRHQLICTIRAGDTTHQHMVHRT